MDWQRTLLPEFFDGLIIKVLVAGVLNDPGQFSIPESLIETFEPCEFLHHDDGDRLAPVGPGDLRRFGKQSERALALEAPRQFAHGFRVRVRFRGPLGGGPVVKEDERTNHFIAPLDVIDKAELKLVKSRPRVHQRVSPLRQTPIGRPQSGARR